MIDEKWDKRPAEQVISDNSSGTRRTSGHSTHLPIPYRVLSAKGSAKKLFVQKPLGLAKVDLACHGDLRCRHPAKTRACRMPPGNLQYITEVSQTGGAQPAMPEKTLDGLIFCAERSLKRW